jgi:predicted ATP-grasp superfamily ATP-dependent carboligase
LAAHHWRQRDNWELVGGRKAICISSNEELRAEYASIARADKRALLQEMVPGGDESLVVAACYLDRHSNRVAGFNIRKLVQVPEGFGTGCIVQATACPELMERTERLLRAMRFTGIAEVEYKWDAAKREYLLIEINPRPWDQHRLGKPCGVDLVHIAYREHAGLAIPAIRLRKSERKWIAEDTFITTALRLLWRRDSRLASLFRHARGKRMYAIWSANDPLPFMAHIALRFIPMLLSSVAQFIWSARERRTRSKRLLEKSALYESQLEEGKSHSHG